MLSYRFLNGGRGLEFKVSGRLTLSENTGVFSEIFRRDFVAQPLLFTWFEYGDEVSRVEMSPAEVRSTAEAYLHSSRRQTITRVTAIYAKNDEPFAREKEWQSVLAPTVEIEVFRERSVALDWLRKRVAELHGFQIEL
jgi:hypothetical protein